MWTAAKRDWGEIASEGSGSGSRSLTVKFTLIFLYDIYWSDRCIKYIYCKKIFIHFVLFKKNIWELVRYMSVESSQRSTRVQSVSFFIYLFVYSLFQCVWVWYPFNQAISIANWNMFIWINIHVQHSWS